MGGGDLSFQTTHGCPRREHSYPAKKPTVVGSVDAFQQATLGLEAGDAVPLTVEHLQPGEDGGIQLCQPIISHI